MFIHKLDISITLFPPKSQSSLQKGLKDCKSQRHNDYNKRAFLTHNRPFAHVTVTGTARTKPEQDQAHQHNRCTMNGGRTNKTLPLAEELLTTDDCWKMANHFSSRVNLLRGYLCTHRQHYPWSHKGSTKWTQRV